MSVVLIGVLAWIGLMLLLALAAVLFHRREQRRRRRATLEYQRLMPCEGYPGLHTNLPAQTYIEHDFKASQEASLKRRDGK